MLRCGSKNGHHKDMWLKEIGRRAHNWLTDVGSIVIMNEGFIRPFNERESLHFDNE